MKRTAPTANQKVVEQKLAVMLRNKVYRVMTDGNYEPKYRSELLSRLGKQYGDQRDLYEALGYQKSLNFDDYMAFYDRGDIGARIVDAPVEECWQQKPTINEPEAENTKFEKAFIELEKLRSIYSFLIRADKLSRIGEYGVLFIGLSDAKNEADLINEVMGTNNELLYLQPYSQKNAVINSWETDVNSDRYALPLTYKIRMGDPANNKKTREVIVHHSRIIHIAEDLLESNIYGTPALKRVYNRMMNLELIVGGSAEMFWQGAFPGMSFEAKDGYDLTQVASELEDEIDMFVHDFKRYMKLIGVEAKVLNPNIADPLNHAMIQWKTISIATGIPMRILTGSERGELASSQDDENWNRKLDSRRVDHVEPNILRKLINKLVEFGCLPGPGANGYEVEWPDLNSPTAKDKAEVGKLISDSIKSFYSIPGIENEIPTEQFLEEILGLNPEKVKRIVDAAAEMEGQIDGEGDDQIMQDENLNG